jgi:hypothetical protein
MIEAYCFRTPTINRLRGGPLGSDRDDLAHTVPQQGDAGDRLRHSWRGWDQFARWLSRHGDAVAEVTPTLVKRSRSGLPRPPADRLPQAAEGLSPLRSFWQQHKRLPGASEEAPGTEANPWLRR